MENEITGFHAAQRFIEPQNHQRFVSTPLKSIHLYDSVNRREGYQETVIENAYADEIDDFISAISNNRRQRYGFEKDYRVLEWIDRIEGKL